MSSLQFLSGISTYHFRPDFVKPGGSAFDIDDLLRNCPNFDIGKELPRRRRKIPTKQMVCLLRAHPLIRIRLITNHLSSQLVGNYGNSDFAQPVTDWRLATYVAVLDFRENLVAQGLATQVWGDPPAPWGHVYAFSTIKKPDGSERNPPFVFGRSPI